MKPSPKLIGDPPKILNNEDVTGESNSILQSDDFAYKVPRVSSDADIPVRMAVFMGPAN